MRTEIGCRRPASLRLAVGLVCWIAPVVTAGASVIIDLDYHRTAEHTSSVAIGAPSVAIIPEHGGGQPVAVPFPNFVIGVDTQADKSIKVTADVGVVSQHVGSEAASSPGVAMSYRFFSSNGLVPGAVATVSLFDAATGALLGSEITGDVGSTGIVTFDLTGVSFESAVLRFAMTLPDIGAAADYGFDITDVSVEGVALTSVAVPEPPSIALLAAGLALLGLAQLRARARRLQARLGAQALPGCCEGMSCTI